MNQSITCVVLSAAIGFATPAVGQDQPLPSDLKAAIMDAVGTAEAKIFQPGPMVAEWNKGGVDLKAAVAAKPGGLARNYLLAVDNEGEPTVTIYSSGPVSGFIPPSWKRIIGIGDIDGGGSDGFLEFANLDGGYYVVARGLSRRVGDADCSSSPIGAGLYLAPDNAETMPREVATAIFEATAAMVSKHTVCETYKASAAGYSVRYFLEDGRSLPAMDEDQDQISIVPAQPVDQLLKPKKD